MSEIPPFQGWPKISRFARTCLVTEKIDGTNAQIFIGDLATDFPEEPLRTSQGQPVFIGSRTAWITPAKDNFGFARFVHENLADLEKLGPGHHFGEWWGKGIQRKYGLTERRFSLFNYVRWVENPEKPECCYVVPLVYWGSFESLDAQRILDDLVRGGSLAAPGFMKPEGIIIFHEPSRVSFKKTVEGDDTGKGDA